MAKSSAEAGIWYVPHSAKRESDPHADCADHEMLAALLNMGGEILRSYPAADGWVERPSRTDLSFLGAELPACAGIFEPAQAAAGEPGSEVRLVESFTAVNLGAFVRGANEVVNELALYDPDIIAAFDLIG